MHLVWEVEDGSWLKAQKAPRRGGEGGEGREGRQGRRQLSGVAGPFVLSLSEWKGSLRTDTEGCFSGLIGDTRAGLERIKQ